MPKLDVQMKDLAHKMTLVVRLKGVDRWAWRVRIATWLLRLAAWIAWMNVEIDTEGSDA